RDAGLSLDEQAIHQAALLHDLARGEKDHAALGALWLEELGYPALAPLVRSHHDWEGGAPDETAVVFLADKAVQRDRRVSLEERFAASQTKCRTAEALAAHQRRREAAVSLYQEMNRLCKSDILMQEDAP
ncbi:MAG: HD domain-containing protein, partial [Oscillospiraceae bacterium]|nr:HD domain-containing protein [Oscillospiraceae bacterium]